ncbi:MAG: tRNA (N(6)-L-threonylcarbamoyladenosine(37)-C(2))-methylthiotransferase MtaB [Candidatus Glassbacteria bacterium]
MKVFFNTFGCKTNQYDSALLGQSLEQAGIELADGPGAADWVVVNTCAVTRRGEDKACQWVRKIGREHPSARIAVVGCSVETSADRFREIEGVKLLLGTEEKFRLGEVLNDLTVEVEKNSGNDRVNVEQAGAVRGVDSFSQAAALTHRTDRSRAYVKIQDGCDNRCTYCIVPYVRGSSRSRPAGQVVQESRLLEAEGHGEAVLTGIHTGGWGRDLVPPGTLSGLVEAILAETGTIRLRLSSIDINEIDSALVDLMCGHPRVCRHLHVPLQHGSDRILQAMGRRYSSAEYAGKLKKITDRIPQLGLGTDVIVGFPGEGEEEFEECRRLIESLPFTYLHVFPYSPRPGTSAARLEGRPPKPVVRERVKVLRELSQAKHQRFLHSLAGAELSVLKESILAGGVTAARAGNYVRVYLRGACPEGVFRARAAEVWRDGVRAEML